MKYKYEYNDCEYEFEYEYLNYEYEYEYEYIACEYEYEFEYNKFVLELYSSMSTSTEYYISASQP